MHAALSYGFEIALALLLVATLYYAMRLEARLGVLKRDRAELERLVEGFNEATLRADAAIGRLRAAAEGTGRELAERHVAAETLRSDLHFLVERGERIADRLDESVRAARPLVADPRAATRPREPEPEEPRVRSQAERDLLKALRLAR